MNYNKTRSRVLSVILILSMILSINSYPVFAAETKYAPIKGDAPITENEEITEDTPIKEDAKRTEDVPITEDAPMTEAAPMTKDAPITEAAPEIPAPYTEEQLLRIAHVQELIDTLPKAEDIDTLSEENRNKTYVQLQDAYDAYTELADQEKIQINESEKFDKLFEFFNGMASTLDAGTSWTDGLVSVQEGYVESGNTITITSAEGLAWLAVKVNGINDQEVFNYSGYTIKLGADIDLSGKSWTPIANIENLYDFAGTFDGGGYAISNMTIEADASYAGLFGYASGTIQNVIIKAPNINSIAGIVGAIAGRSAGSVIRCGVEGGTVKGTQYVGGVVGQSYKSESAAQIEGCYNLGAIVEATAGSAAGIVSVYTGYVKSCFSTGTVKASKASAITNGWWSGTTGGSGADLLAYLDTSEAFDSLGKAYTEEEFHNGTVANYLNFGSGSTQQYTYWGQTIKEQSYPVLGGSAVRAASYYKLVEANVVSTKIYVNQPQYSEEKQAYIITNVNDWAAFVSIVNNGEYAANAEVQEGAVIDFSSLGTLAYNSENTNMTIGNSNTVSKFYTGKFRGNGCKITGLQFSSTTNYSRYSLFGYLGSDADVSGITMEEPVISGHSNLSGIAREVRSGATISDCHIKGGSITGTAANVAGIAATSGGTIRSCSNSAAITGSQYTAGIVAGLSASGVSNTSPMEIAECINTGAVNATISSTAYAGGIYGGHSSSAYVNIKMCTNRGEITGYSYTGGIAGSIKEELASFGITDCGNSGAVKGTSYLGGITGYASGAMIKNCYNTADIGTENATTNIAGISGYSGTATYCYNTGTISGTTYVQPLVAYSIGSSGTYENNYAKEDCCKTSYTGTLYYGGSSSTPTKGKRTAGQFASGEVAYELNEFVSGKTTWYQKFGENADISPVLVSTGNNTVYAIAGIPPTGTAVTYGYSNNPDATPEDVGLESPITEAPAGYVAADDGNITLQSKEAFMWFTMVVNGTTGKESQSADDFSGKTVTLGTDIDFKGRELTQIGKYSSSLPIAFAGTFDGNKHTLSNFKITSDQGYTGLFAYNKGTIRDLAIKDAVVTSTKSNAGILAARNEGTVERCGTEGGSITAGNYVAGIVGFNYSTTLNPKVIGCYNLGTEVSATGSNGYAAGIVSSYSGIVQSCFSTGKITATNISKTGAFVNSYCGASFGTNSTGDMAGLEGTANSFSSGKRFTVEQFKSGEAARYLTYGDYSVKKNDYWGQSIGQDDYPVLGGTSVMSVSYYQMVDGTNTSKRLYVNEPQFDKDKNAYIIKNVLDWAGFASIVNNGTYNANAEVEVNAVIDFSKLGTMSYFNKSYNLSIGNSSSTAQFYTGTFKGNGCKVTGLKYSAAKSNSTYSLFGYLGGTARISGITVIEPEIQAYESVAAIAGTVLHGAEITDCHVQDGSITAVNRGASGIACTNGGKITNCSNSAKINALMYVGGITATLNTTNVTAASPMQIENCSNSGVIRATNSSGASYAGGIYGGDGTNSNIYIDIKNCANTGNIFGLSYLGGIAGYAGGSGTKITSCYNTASVGTESSITNVAGISGYSGVVTYCYNTGTITGSTYAQPLVAYSSVSRGTYDNDYSLEGCCITSYKGTLYYGGNYDTPTQGQRTKEAFASGEVTYLLNGDQSNIVFYQICGEGSPQFKGSQVYRYEVKNCDGQSQSPIVYGYSNEADHADIILQHSYSDPVFTWTENAENGGYDCRAKRICSINSTHTDELLCTITSVTKPATSDEPEKIVYTAKVTFDNKEYTDTKEIVVMCEVKVTSKDTKGNVVTAALTGGGQHQKGKSVTVAAQVNDPEGYKFLGWYNADTESGVGYTGDCLSTERLYAFTISKNENLVAIYKAMGSVCITFDGGQSDYSVNGSIASKPQNKGFTVGTVIALSVTNPKDFAYWKNASDVVVSRSPDYTFTATIKDSLTAVYKTAAQGNMIVVWETDSGQVLQRTEYSAETLKLAKAPVLPVRFGYNVTGWNQDAASLTFTLGTMVTIKPVSVLIEQTYQISITGGTLDKADGKYNISTVAKAVADEAGAGQKFSHWKDTEDNILSYNTTYQFYVTKDVSLTAVFVSQEAEVEAVGTADIIQISYDANKKYLSFVSLHTIPSDCTINFAGIVATTDTAQAANLTKDNAAYVRGVTNPGTKTHRVTWTKSQVESGATWYARAYLVYTTAAGDIVEIYSDMDTTIAGN